MGNFVLGRALRVGGATRSSFSVATGDDSVNTFIRLLNLVQRRDPSEFVFSRQASVLSAIMSGCLVVARPLLPAKSACISSTIVVQKNQAGHVLEKYSFCITKTQ